MHLRERTHSYVRTHRRTKVQGWAVRNTCNLAELSGQYPFQSRHAYVSIFVRSLRVCCSSSSSMFFIAVVVVLLLGQDWLKDWLCGCPSSSVASFRKLSTAPQHMWHLHCGTGRHAAGAWQAGRQVGGRVSCQQTLAREVLSALVDTHPKAAASFPPFSFSYWCALFFPVLFSCC